MAVLHRFYCTSVFLGDPKFWGEDINGNTLLCLLGTQGYGKTTLMARVAQEASKVLQIKV